MLQIKFHSNQPTGGGVRVLRRENSQKQKNQDQGGGGGGGGGGGRVLRVFALWGQGGCEQGIEVFVKIHKKIWGGGVGGSSEVLKFL